MAVDVFLSLQSLYLCVFHLSVSVCSCFCFEFHFCCYQWLTCPRANILHRVSPFFLNAITSHFFDKSLRTHTYTKIWTRRFVSAHCVHHLGVYCIYMCCIEICASAFIQQFDGFTIIELHFLKTSFIGFHLIAAVTI